MTSGKSAGGEPFASSDSGSGIPPLRAEWREETLAAESILSLIVWILAKDLRLQV